MYIHLDRARNAAANHLNGRTKRAAVATLFRSQKWVGPKSFGRHLNVAEPLAVSRYGEALTDGCAVRRKH